MSEILNQIEQDFIEFMSTRTHKSPEKTEQIFRKTKNRYKFATEEYAGLTGDVARLYRIMYDTSSEEEAIRCYQVHALLHLFRFISYTYPKPKSSYLHEFIRDMKKLQWRNLYNFIRRKLKGENKKSSGPGGTMGTAEYLLSNIEGDPVVVDYGCGMGYISFEIGQLNSNTRIYLVDIDCLTLEFAEYRFRKHGLNVETIHITPECVYPELPEHNICIAREVMEHVFKPLDICDNIYKSLAENGLLYGNFDDHEVNMYHLSPNLKHVRTQIEQNYMKIGTNTFRKAK